jgi:hypothetical protein
MDHARKRLRESAAEWARRTAREQGLPEMIEDEATLQEIAILFTAGRDSRQPRSRRATPPDRVVES